MIEVTATMFPRTVRNDRSLFAQIAASAILIDSKSWYIWFPAFGLRPAARGGVMPDSAVSREP